MRRVALSLTLAALFPLFGLAACSDASDGPVDQEEPGKPDDEGKVVDGKADAWNSTNNPSRFQLSFEYGYDALKQYSTGRAEQTPWPSDYWSYYEDSINVRYHGANELSPVEKYDKAFNAWEPNMSVTPMMVSGYSSDCQDGKIVNKHDDYYSQLGPAAKWQHENKGNYRARNGKDDDADGEIDECGADYDGIETWWGLCHAWVPAAILEPEPLHDVTVNGVNFTVSDIKALLISMYDSNRSLMLGGRCNEKEVERDEYGRITRDECRDTNAGAFHVVITNMLGKNKRSFAEDRTYGYQVWNQPVLGYTIAEDRELTEEEAVTELKRPGTKYAETFNSPNAVAWRLIRMNVQYITESSNTEEGPLTENISRFTRTDPYKYIVELDKDGKIVGGEWITLDRPDFLWLPLQQVSGNPKMSFAKIKNLLELSRKTDEHPPASADLVVFGGPTDVAIPDNQPTGIVHEITVTDDIQIAALKVKIDIEHSYIGDLRIVLEKDGVQAVLHDKQGGGADDIHATFDAPAFAGKSAKGTWKLIVTDTASADKGSLKSVELQISKTATAPVTRNYSSNVLMSIPDNNADGISSVINATDAGTVDTAKVTVNITHPYIGDLIVTVKRGEFTQVLHSREGGSADNINKSYTLTGFNGAQLQGDWSLVVVDKANLDKGSLDSWTLETTLR